ncbi:MAG: hypothetical protein GXX07_02300 [Wolinella succinogenes]|uniref:symporter small accessory protein n=1 Tax=Wolinella succinogenes TaxID=844 RepID=UPI0016A01323|nr:symporter small accessory protein [Wolinella succinogenes]NLU33776.1 hypothetical protein [Wolinella succinogenes]
MEMMDGGIKFAYALTLLSTLLCVLYGIKYWNKEEGGSAQEKERSRWLKAEESLKEEF